MPTLAVTKTYLNSNVLSETDLDNIKNSIESFFNTTLLDSVNLDCNSIGQGMTVTGANAVATSMTDSAVTTILAKISTTEGYRVQENGSSILNFKAPLNATGSTISSFSGTSTTVADITNATVTLTVRGRPIYFQLQSTSTGTTAADGSVVCGNGATILLVRGSTTVHGVQIGNPGASNDQQPVSSIAFIDYTPGTGSVTYKLQYGVTSASDPLVIKTARLVAVEL